MQMRHRVRPTPVAQIAVGAQEQPCAEVPRPRKSQGRPKTRCAASAKKFVFLAKSLRSSDPYYANPAVITVVVINDLLGSGRPCLSSLTMGGRHEAHRHSGFDRLDRSQHFERGREPPPLPF